MGAVLSVLVKCHANHFCFFCVLGGGQFGKLQVPFFVNLGFSEEVGKVLDIQVEQRSA